MSAPDPFAAQPSPAYVRACDLGAGLWTRGECMSCTRGLAGASDWGQAVLALQLAQRVEVQASLLAQCDAACLVVAQNTLLSLGPQGTSELGRALFRACDRLRDELERRANAAFEPG